MSLLVDILQDPIIYQDIVIKVVIHVVRLPQKKIVLFYFDIFKDFANKYRCANEPNCPA